MQNHHGLLYMCRACLKPYHNKRALSAHLANSMSCMEIFDSLPYQITGNTEINCKRLSSVNLKVNAKPYTSNQVVNNSQVTNNESDETLEEITNSPSMDECNSYQPYHFSNDKYQEIKLLKLLNNLGTPLYAYKLIMEWAKEAHLSNYNFDCQHTSHKQMIRYLQKKLQIKICQPTVLPVTLMHDNFQADVVVFDVRQMLMSLFDNQELNQMDNLVVNLHNAFSKYDLEDNRFGEINSGTWYNKAYQTCIKNPVEDFLCPIVLASDKTTLSDMGDLHVDAIFMTTSIFDIKVSAAIL